MKRQKIKKIREWWASLTIVSMIGVIIGSLIYFVYLFFSVFGWISTAICFVVGASIANIYFLFMEEEENAKASKGSE